MRQRMYGGVESPAREGGLTRLVIVYWGIVHTIINK